MEREVLRVPLHTEHEPLAIYLDSLDHAAWLHGHYAYVLAGTVDGLIVQRVDATRFAPQNTHEPGILLHTYFFARQKTPDIGRFAIEPSEMLVQAASEHDVDQLRATTYPEYR